MTYLNVVLHGLYLLVLRRATVEVLIPDMGADHAYRAGEWLGERNLAPGTYFLTGVVPGTGGCDPNQNVIIDRCHPVCDPPNLYARIVMPKPMCFDHFGQVQLTPNQLIVDPSVTFSGYTMSTVQVLRYQIADDDPRNVKLGSHYFTKSAQFFDDGDYTGNYMSLHILSTPDRPEISNHTENGFNAVLSMGEGLAGNISLQSPPPVPDTGTQNPHGGLIAAELRSLSRRMDRQTDLGRFLRQVGGEPETINAKFLTGVDGDIVTCTELLVDTGE